MAKLYNAAPAFFVRNPQGRDGISPNPSLLAAYRTYSAAQLVPRSGWNPSPSRATKQVLTGLHPTSGASRRGCQSPKDY